MAAVVGMQAVANGLVGGFLHGDIQRGVDAQTLLVNGCGAVSVLEILADVFDEVGSEIVATGGNVKTEGFLGGGRGLRRGDFVVARHERKHKIAPGEGAIRMVYGSIDGAANNRGERGGFRERQLADRPAEIIFGGGFEAVVAGAEINLIAVHGENLVFGVMALDLQGENGFLNFAVQAAVGAIEKEPASELHGQGAGAFSHAAFGNIAPGGFEDAREVHAPVLFEVLIFGGDDGVFQYFRNLPVGKQDAALEREGADGLAVVGVKLGDDVGAIIFQGVNFRQVAGVNKQQAYSGAEGDGAQQQESERKTAEERVAGDLHRGAVESFHCFAILSHPRRGRSGRSSPGVPNLFNAARRATRAENISSSVNCSLRS